VSICVHLWFPPSRQSAGLAFQLDGVEAGAVVGKKTPQGRERLRRLRVLPVPAGRPGVERHVEGRLLGVAADLVDVLVATLVPRDPLFAGIASQSMAPGESGITSFCDFAS
jgi:hypothetical protein